MTLSSLKENQSAIITKLPNDERFALRLCEIGISKGQKIVCVIKSVFGSPILYFVKDSFISLRLSDAKKIEVEYE